MWYAILIIALMVAVLMWQFYKVCLHAYIAFMVDQDVKQPTTEECRKWFRYALKRCYSINNNPKRL